MGPHPSLFLSPNLTGTHVPKRLFNLVKVMTGRNDLDVGPGHRTFPVHPSPRRRARRAQTERLMARNSPQQRKMGLYNRKDSCGIFLGPQSPCFGQTTLGVMSVTVAATAILLQEQRR